MIIPGEISNFFSASDFETYPKIKIPQEFIDERGTIRNIADGVIGDVAIISCNAGSIRANHFHEEDWHLSYLITGKLKYSWAENFESEIQSLIIQTGELFFTKPKSPHKMEFLEDSTFIAISKLSRLKTNYESDTQRLNGFFN